MKNRKNKQTKKHTELLGYSEKGSLGYKTVYTINKMILRPVKVQKTLLDVKRHHWGGKMEPLFRVETFQSTKDYWWWKKVLTVIKVFFQLRKLVFLRKVLLGVQNGITHLEPLFSRLA